MEEKLFFDVFDKVIHEKICAKIKYKSVFFSDSCIQTCSGTKNYAFLNKQVRAFDEY